MDTIIHSLPASSSVVNCLAALTTVRELLNANEDPAQENSLGKTHGEVQDLFVAQPVRSLADVILKLQFIVDEDELDAIDERIVQDVIDYLRSQVAA
jgi:hypothetical protein